MPIPSDYKELLSILNRHRVKYLIVGAYAVIHYTEPRYTKDIDVWIKPEIKNAVKLYQALKDFGAPLKNITVEDFTNKDLVYQMGVEPVRIDIIMGLSGVEFDRAWQNRSVANFDGIKVNITGINELIQSKIKTKRRTDMIDIEHLEYRLQLKNKKK